jgi:hypothetical protein
MVADAGLGEPALTVELRPAIGRHVERHRLRSLMDDSMTNLSRNFLFREVVRGQGPAGGFQGMANDLAQKLVTGLLELSQDPADLPQAVADELAMLQATVAGQSSALAKIGEKLAATQVPGPFVDLKTEAADFFVKQALGIRIAGQKPALEGGEKQPRPFRRINRPPSCRAARQPGEIFRLQDEQSLASAFPKKGSNSGLFGIYVGAAVGVGKGWKVLGLLGGPGLTFRWGGHENYLI